MHFTLNDEESSVAMATVKITEKLTQTLAECSLFEGIPEEKFPNLLSCLQAKRTEYQKNETILNIGDRSRKAGIVLSGSVVMSFPDESGHEINVRHISECDIFGTDLACLQGGTSLLQLRAVSDCAVLSLDFSSLMEEKDNFCPFRMRFASNLLKNFARQSQFLNLRMRIISQKRLRDKIKVCLQDIPADETGTIHLPFKRNDWADFLYADRSALSRELSRMADEGIIAYRGQQICVLDRNFLKI